MFSKFFRAFLFISRMCRQLLPFRKLWLIFLHPKRHCRLSENKTLFAFLIFTKVRGDNYNFTKENLRDCTPSEQMFTEKLRWMLLKE